METDQIAVTVVEAYSRGIKNKQTALCVVQSLMQRIKFVFPNLSGP